MINCRVGHRRFLQFIFYVACGTGVATEFEINYNSGKTGIVNIAFEL